MRLTLVPFTRDLLPAVQEWFRHPEVVRWLGGPDWPVHGLEAPPPGPDEWHRGHRILRAHTWVATTPTGTPVAHIGGDVLATWSPYSAPPSANHPSSAHPAEPEPAEPPPAEPEPGRPDRAGSDRVVPFRAEPGPAMGFAYVVSPAHWRQGIGRATLRAMFEAPELADVRLFAAGIEPENVASLRCARSAGMVPISETPDDEGMLHYVLRR